MSLKDRIANGQTTSRDAERYELKNRFALGILRRGAILLILFLMVGLAAGVAIGYLLP